MDQKSICVFLHKKGLSSEQVHSELVQVLGTEAVAYSTVTKYIRSSSFKAIRDESISEDSDDETNLIDDAILQALEDEPFASVRRIASKTYLPKSTVYRHLVSSLQYTVKHLTWIPHTLTNEQKGTRVSKSIELLALLRSMEHQSWVHFVTLDESWFYLSTDYEFLWLPRDEPPPTRSKKMIDSPKTMLTVAWSPAGNWHVDVLPKGHKFDAAYYVSDILQPLLLTHFRRDESSPRHLVVHADNARPHTAKFTLQYCEAHSIRIAPHPPYSPDLAPSDFFLFGYLKDQLRGMTFETSTALMEQIHAILAKIPSSMFKKVFDEWMLRLEQCIRTNGEYIS